MLNRQFQKKVACSSRPIALSIKSHTKQLRLKAADFTRASLQKAGMQLAIDSRSRIRAISDFD